MKFKSGMLGVCIVVLALLGTVLGGFILGIDQSTRTVTDYEYVTDVTGLFDISDAPEYVEYSPSSNLVGYSPSSSVQYTESSTVNSYRYVVQDGARDISSSTITNASSYASNTGRFLPAEAGSSAYIQWNGNINFGSSVTFHGITYNGSAAGESVQVGEVMGSWPMITSLSTVLQSLGLSSYGTLEIDLSYGAFPVMFYNSSWTFVNIERGDGSSQYGYVATLNESNTMPQHMTVNMATNTVSATRGGVTMWNTNADQIDVIYRYSTRAGGSFSPASTSVTMSITAIGYPTYGYMDPTKGVTMSVTDYSAEYAIPTNASTVYDLSSSLPILTNTTNAFGYIANFTGWGGNWNGSATVGGYTLQGIVPMTVVDPSMPRVTPNIQSFKQGFVTNFGLTEYDLYTLDFTHTAFPIYMSKLFNGRPDNFLTIGSVLDSNANQIQSMYYLETSYTPVIDRATYDPDTDVVVAYAKVNGNYVQQWTGDADDIWVVSDYYLLDSSLQNVSPTSSSYYVNHAPIDTRVTITADRDIEATWSNGYQNDEINISLQRVNLNGNDLTIIANGSYVKISTNSSGYMTAEINGVSHNIGVWKYAQIRIDATEGTISITPSTRISFTEPINESNATQTFTGFGNGSPITSMTFTTTDQSLRWQITRTTVFLDTYNAVMFNPNINITSHFPDIDEYRLNFFSFALYGDQMSINSKGFTVNRSNATVTFTLDDETYTEKLQNIYITNREGDGGDHTYLTFGNSKTEYDLGLTVTNTIYFTGIWYFTTGFYKAVTVTEDYYDWQLDGLWHIDSSQFLVIFIGLIALGLLVMRGVFGVSVKSMDGIVVIFAGIIITLIVI